MRQGKIVNRTITGDDTEILDNLRNVIILEAIPFLNRCFHL